MQTGCKLRFGSIEAWHVIDVETVSPGSAAKCEGGPLTQSGSEGLTGLARYCYAVEQQIDTLVGTSLGVSGVDLRCQAMEAIMALGEEQAALAFVNRDITPENLLAHDARWVGLVEPVPLQDSGTYYAALFLHCYRVYLPAMSHAPRYAQHRFHEQTATLAAIADGYERAYAQADSVMRQRLRMAEWLWTLQLVAKILLCCRVGSMRRCVYAGVMWRTWLLPSR